jgi:6-pyruvoyltetrahydropterin/6-carboxytetrahydropterin synthase
MITITKEIKWEGGHRLYDSNLPAEENEKLYGKCFNIHGHSYRLQVEIATDEMKNGFVMNFTDLKEVLEHIKNHYDHRCTLMAGDPLIEVLKPSGTRVTVLPVIPTCENQIQIIANDLLEIFSTWFGRKIYIVSITLWETASSYCTWSNNGLIKSNSFDE